MEKFARELLRKRNEATGANPAGANDPFDTLFKNLPTLTALAERAASAAGLDFTPSPEETMDGARQGRGVLSHLSTSLSLSALTTHISQPMSRCVPPVAIRVTIHSL